MIRLGTERARPIDWAIVALVLVVGFAAIRHREAVAALESGRREEAESFARILSSLSRSVSPDAILGAIVDELAEATGADHIVIARRRPDARVLEATLVSARPGVHDSTTLLPIGDLEDPIEHDGPSDGREPVAIPVVADEPERVPAGGCRGRLDELATRIDAAAPLAGRADRRQPATGRRPGERQQIAERIAARARQVYGLTNTLAAPLTSDVGVIGAIVLSHRRAGAWSPTTRRILNGAAVEASAALSRAYSHRAAETQASTDALTGLPNRRYFDEFCGLLARRRRSGDAVGVLMIDIDRFKVLNDDARTRDRRRGPAGGRRRDHRGRPRGRRPGPLRWRGIRRPVAQPDAGGRVRGRGARPRRRSARSTFAGSASRRSASRSGSRSRARPTSRSATSSPTRTGRSIGPSAGAATGSSRPDRGRRLPARPTTIGR